MSRREYRWSSVRERRHRSVSSRCGVDPGAVATGRALGVTALLPVVVLFPVFLMAMVVLWLPLRFVFGVPYWIVPWRGWRSAVLLFVPPVQVARARPLPRHAPDPATDELTVIAPDLARPGGQGQPPAVPLRRYA